MKKLLSILLIAVLALSIVGCTETETEEIVLPPTRYGIYGGIVDYFSYDMAYFYEQADAVARVKVGNWLWENCQELGSDYTFYEAEILECYKGSMPEDFILIQSGSSRSTEHGPLFTYGDEKLLFLSKAEAGFSPYKDAYHCGTISTMVVSCDDAGTRYFLATNAFVGESITRTTPIKDIPVSEVRKNATQSDPLLNERRYESAPVFSEEDIKLFFASLEQEEIVPRPEKKTGVLPLTRFGKGSGAFEDFPVEYTFESLYSQADAVARLTVGDWLREDAELEASYYEASLVEGFKGEIPKTFTLKQDGCSQDSKGHPLFTYGNEVLLFLKEEEGENTYGFLESYTAIIDVSYDDEGLAYYVVRHDDFGATVPGQDLDPYEDLTFEVYENLLEQDLMISREREVRERIFDRNNPYIFPVSDLNAWFEAQKNG